MAPVAEVFKAEPPTAFDSVVGLLVASVFSTVYLLAPLYVIGQLIALVLAPTSPVVWACAVPLLVSVAIPPTACPNLVQSAAFGCMLRYFSFEMRCEKGATTTEIEEHTAAGRHFVLAAQPHGIISYVGICSASACSRKLLLGFPTAAASVIMKFPVLKNVMGVFGLVDASKGSLMRALTRHGVVIYIGGIAELFLSSARREVLFVQKRKGFIKLAMQAGCDVIPLYLFGNTTVLSALSVGPLAALSRSAGVSLTYFWGRWGLPLPRPVKLVYVRGAPLGMPKIDEPTQQQIDEWHAKYVSEVTRIFNEHKGTLSDYAEKQLEMR